MADAGAGVDHEAVTMGGPALSKVGYDRYLKFVWPFLAAVFVSRLRVPRHRSGDRLIDLVAPPDRK